MINLLSDGLDNMKLWRHRDFLIAMLFQRHCNCCPNMRRRLIVSIALWLLAMSFQLFPVVTRLWCCYKLCIHSLWHRYNTCRWPLWRDCNGPHGRWENISLIATMWLDWDAWEQLQALEMPLMNFPTKLRRRGKSVIGPGLEFWVSEHISHGQ